MEEQKEEEKEDEEEEEEEKEEEEDEEKTGWPLGNIRAAMFFSPFWKDLMLHSISVEGTCIECS